MTASWLKRFAWANGYPPLQKVVEEIKALREEHKRLHEGYISNAQKAKPMSQNEKSDIHLPGERGTGVPDYYIVAGQRPVGMRLRPFTFRRRSQIHERSKVTCFREPAAPAIRLRLSELVNPYPVRCYATGMVVTCMVRDKHMSQRPITAELWTGESLLWACHIGRDLLGEHLPLANHQRIVCGKTEDAIPVAHIYFPPIQDCHAVFHVDSLPEQLRDAPVEVEFTLYGFRGAPVGVNHAL